MNDRFTVVFKGDIRAFDGNPLHIVSPFGEVVAGGIGDEFAVADALRAENARLTEREKILSKDNIHRSEKIIEFEAENAKLREALKSCYDWIEEVEGPDNLQKAARAAMGENDG